MSRNQFGSQEEDPYPYYPIFQAHLLCSSLMQSPDSTGKKILFINQ